MDSLIKDLALTLLGLLPNLSVVALLCTNRYWNAIIKDTLALRGFIPLEESTPLYDIHYGPARMPPGQCLCSICAYYRRVMGPQVRIIKHVAGPYDDNWKDYIHPDDHPHVPTLEGSNTGVAVVVPSQISISCALARAIHKLTNVDTDQNLSSFTPAKDLEKYINDYNSSLIRSNIYFPAKTNEPSGDFCYTLFPLYGSIFLNLTDVATTMIYCCDKTSPHYDHVIFDIRNGTHTGIAYQQYDLNLHLKYMQTTGKPEEEHISFLGIHKFFPRRKKLNPRPGTTKTNAQCLKYSPPTPRNSYYIASITSHSWPSPVLATTGIILFECS